MQSSVAFAYSIVRKYRVIRDGGTPAKSPLCPKIFEMNLTVSELSP